MDAWIQNAYTSLLECDLVSKFSGPHTSHSYFPNVRICLYLVAEEKIQQAAKVGFRLRDAGAKTNVFVFDCSNICLQRESEENPM